MPRYTITEPHPTVQKNAYTHSGRGGAGNTFRAPSTTPASGVPTAPGLAKSSSSRFYSGRGGAGNAHAADVRPAYSFSEEYVLREKSQLSAHVGRGGAGNVLNAAKKESHRKNSTSSAGSSRRDSDSTTGSVRAGFWGRLSGASLGHHN